MALISICVPTYNGERYLRECLASALAQTYGEIEVVVVDDSSNDGTVAVAREFMAKDPRVTLHCNASNLGLVANWNRCIALAKGEWIKFLFQDDVLYPRCLEAMLQPKSRRFIVCQRDFLFEPGVTDATRARYERLLLESSPKPVFDHRTDIAADAFAAAVLQQFPINFLGEPTSMLLHRSLFAEFGSFHDGFVQLCDYEFWCRVGIHAGVTHVPSPHVAFRVHAESTTARNNATRAFRADVIDELLLRQRVAEDTVFQPLREAAQLLGTDLRLGLREQVTFQQLWGAHWRSSLWPEAVANYPFLRMPLQQRVRRSLKRLLIRP